MTGRRDGPVYVVHIVTSGGVEPLDVTDQVTRFQYVDRERAADKLTLTVDNFDLANFDDPVWKKGTLLDVSWGYLGNMAPTRRCVIKSVNGDLELQIEALGQELLFNRDRKSRTFENMTRSEVVSRIANENGWSGDRLDVQDTEIRHETIVQARRTDAEFIRRLARLEGFQWFIDFDGFHFHERRVGAPPNRIYVWHNDTGQGDVIGFSVENDVTARPARVRLRGRNPRTGQNFTVEASNETDRSRDVLAPIAAIVDPETGAVSRVPTRSRSVEPAARVAQAETRPTSAQTPEAARRVARARFRRAQQAAVKLELDLIGSPGLLAKSVVETKGMGRRLSQRYYVKEVTHTIDPQGPGGYEMQAKLISDGHGGHSTATRRLRGAAAIEVGRTPRRKRTSGRQNNQAPTAAAQRTSGQGQGGGGSGRSPREGQPLEPVQRVDPETGRIVTRYRDVRERPRSTSAATRDSNE